ncbi:NAD-dependent epimerase/dehydratase family protein [Streptomyces sp. NBC_00249]|uniref:NAD-dependent epimerase/dehydratase family protein n=1 Tax=Streptomyces sp. NBC_00249 TaxID=2975690 RepID=UPI002252FCB5|nr:NAD-dependent epimerase/dehydratase family protein [Streptomyces sp. NBC_00249]MCX5199478.1 NAD-dependent epimerase/dehydratase family protein [Streptomyces sp. NBC_00249]
MVGAPPPARRSGRRACGVLTAGAEVPMFGNAEEKYVIPDGGHTRVVVLGGTGFVGRHVCAAFVDEGREVVAVSRRAEPAGPGVLPLALDLCATAPAALARVLTDGRPTTVVNAAGAVWAASEREMVTANTELVRRLVDALCRAEPPVRLVHLGSVNEYSPGRQGRPVDESAPTRPTTVYGRTKLRGTELVLDAAGRGDIDALVLRMANVAGPGSPPASLLGRVAQQLHLASLEGRTAEIRLAPLRAARDFVDAADAGAAVSAAARSSVGARVLNIGSGEAVSVRSLVDLLIRVSGVPARVVETPPAPDVAAAPPEWLEVDVRLARQLLGWAPQRQLTHAVAGLWRALADR